ncbi:MAG: hypothetical protein R8L53_06320 [Mariprofundales bacterium]
MTTLLERALVQPPYWAGQKIKAWPEEEMRELMGFATKEYWCAEGGVNVFNVIGTRHNEYHGLTWLELLQQGKRMHLNLPLHTNHPEYYQEVDAKHAMSCISINGINWYVDADGNHRTCIARFHFDEIRKTHVYGVSLQQYTIAWELRALAMDLIEKCNERKIPVSVQPLRKSIMRQDAAGCKTDYYNVSLKVQHNNETKMLGITEAKDLITEIQQPFYRRWFSVGGNYAS